MIRFSLVCSSGHGSDSWFRDGASFEHQAARGLLSCPTCGTRDVAKAIMAPAPVGGRGGAPELAEPHGSAGTNTGSASAKPASEPALNDDKSRELRALVRKMRDRLLAEGHDVGRDFASEARRIHDGEAPVRQIYGQASIGEARDLLEDGIAVLPLPIVPDELN